MALFEVAGDALKPQPIAEFAALQMYERDDLQRLLREDLSVLGRSSS